MKLGVCSVIYNPTNDELINLKRISESGLPTFYYANGGLHQAFEDAVVIGSNDNIGLSKGMNRIFRRAFSEDLDALLFLDQDSILNTEKLYENYQMIINSLPKRGMISLLLEDTIEKNRLFINSGLIITKTAYENIGDFNETYFVDNIDYDYALRADILGYKILGLRHFDIIDHFQLQPKQKIMGDIHISWRDYKTRFVEIFFGLRNLIILSAKKGKYGFMIKLLNILLKELTKYTIIKIIGAIK
jgi:rhamnosyltransferase